MDHPRQRSRFLGLLFTGDFRSLPDSLELYFRRFLNRDRMALNKLPDIDIARHDRKDAS